jgi:hypothetical protein
MRFSDIMVELSFNHSSGAGRPSNFFAAPNKDSPPPPARATCPAMNRLSFWLISLTHGLATGASALPAAGGGGGNFSVTTDFGYATSYVFRGLQLSRHSLQPGITVERGNFSGGLWANVPTERGEAHEIDPSVFYSIEGGGLTWASGLQVYTYPEARGTDTTHSYELSLGTTAPLGLITGVPVNAGITVCYDLRLATLSLEARLEHSLEFKFAEKPAEFAAGLFVGSVDGRDVTPDDPGAKYRDFYVYYGAKASLSCKLSDRTALKFTAQWDDARQVDPSQGHTGNLSGVFALSWLW